MPKGKQKQRSVAETAGRIRQEDLVKALNHPVRVKALAILSERVASPTEISAEIGVPLSHVSYHVRVLDELEMIEIVGEEPVRGAVKHYYKAVQRPYLDTAEMEQLDSHVRSGMAAWTFEALIKSASEALSGGTFDARPEYHFSRTPLQLDEKGFQNVGEILRQALESIMEEQAASSERISAANGDSFPVVAAMFSFEVPKKPTA